jgi:hypothetical protein
MNNADPDSLLQNPVALPLIPMTHSECVATAALYIGKRYPVTLPEFYTHNTELPDVFGYKDHSVVVECKISRSDFLADKKKPFRINPKEGMGDYRYYCCPKGMIRKEELPKGWGLLYIYPGGRVREIKGSHWPAEPNADLSKDWLRGGKFPKNKDAELHLLYYYARRAYYAGVHSAVLAYRGYDG